MINTLRISKDEFRAKLESIDSTSINKKADRFITTYLKSSKSSIKVSFLSLLSSSLSIPSKSFHCIYNSLAAIQLSSVNLSVRFFKYEVIELEDEEIESQKKVAKIIVHSRGV